MAERVKQQSGAEKRAVLRGRVMALVAGAGGMVDFDAVRRALHEEYPYHGYHDVEAFAARDELVAAGELMLASYMLATPERYAQWKRERRRR